MASAFYPDTLRWVQFRPPRGMVTQQRLEGGTRAGGFQTSCYPRRSAWRAIS